MPLRSPAPLVSVVIPTHNRWPLVADAVRSALGQDAGGVEVIVVDDGSTDRTVEQLRSSFPDVHVECQANGERGAARNRGASVAAGRYLAFLDSDDLLEPAHVAQLRAVLDARAASGEPLPDVVSTPAAMWDPGTGHRQTLPSRWVGRRGLSDATLLGTVLPLQGLFVSKTAFAAVGGFPEDRAVACSEDWVFGARLAASFPVVRTGEPSVLIRDHPGRSVVDPRRVAAARQAAMSLVLAEGLAGSPLDARSRRLVVGGTHRLCAANYYGAGMMREARTHAGKAFRALGLKDGSSLVGRIWIQSWMGGRASRVARRLRPFVASLRS